MHSERKLNPFTQKLFRNLKGYDYIINSLKLKQSAGTIAAVDLDSIPLVGAPEDTVPADAEE